MDRVAKHKARERQRRFQSRRREEWVEQKQIVAEKSAQSLRNSHPELYAAVTSPDFVDAWHRIYREPPPDLSNSDPAVVEYILEIMRENAY